MRPQKDMTQKFKAMCIISYRIQSRKLFEGVRVSKTVNLEENNQAAADFEVRVALELSLLNAIMFLCNSTQFAVAALTSTDGVSGAIQFTQSDDEYVAEGNLISCFKFKKDRHLFSSS
ncbi:hypothetical protein O6H91_11G118400 [Diphasiastrum complanatum]|uniref:Uncharacterized protein n=1 Tax=Diphasiastrum complanatum TaxID=34168 RepID=A0ACC2CDS6_DIPCM|nr:hypothetical protein O6H91_11G118400 [Diphasiastrum complanatum]